MTYKKRKDMEEITQEEIDKVFTGTHFGTSDPWALVKNSLLKVGCGYSSGHTITQILAELGLIKIKRDRGFTIKMTPRGEYWCYQWFAIKPDYS